MNKISILQQNCNKYGDYQIQVKKGDICTKWYSLLYLWDIMDKKAVWLLNNATDRTLYPCEIVLDFDPDKNQTKKDLLEYIKTQIKKHGLTGKLYDTGGNGYHYHIINYDLINYRKIIRTIYIKKFGADLNLIGDKHMILLEGEKNRKTGKIKERI